MIQLTTNSRGQSRKILRNSNLIACRNNTLYAKVEAKVSGWIALGVSADGTMSSSGQVLFPFSSLTLSRQQEPILP